MTHCLFALLLKPKAPGGQYHRDLTPRTTAAHTTVASAHWSTAAPAIAASPIRRQTNSVPRSARTAPNAAQRAAFPTATPTPAARVPWVAGRGKPTRRPRPMRVPRRALHRDDGAALGVIVRDRWWHQPRAESANSRVTSPSDLRPKNLAARRRCDQMSHLFAAGSASADRVSTNSDVCSRLDSASARHWQSSQIRSFRLSVDRSDFRAPPG